VRALVFGAAGFVGKHLTEHLQGAGDTVYLAGIRTSGTPVENEFAVDITDAAAVRRVIQEVEPDTVYHLAGIAFVPEAEGDFDRVLSINVGGTAHIIRECHELNARVNFVFASSAEVYGAINAADLPVTESAPARPKNNYSASKQMAELIVERYAREGRVQCSIARPFNHIGPGQEPRFVASNFALQLARIARGEAAPIIRVGNLEARRDFSDVRDIVRAYRLLSTSSGGTFNLGSGKAYSIQYLLDVLIGISGVEVTLETDPERMRGPEVAEVYTSLDKVQSLCGWSPVIPLERSLEDVYRCWFDRLASE